MSFFGGLAPPLSVAPAAAGAGGGGKPAPQFIAFAAGTGLNSINLAAPSGIVVGTFMVALIGGGQVGGTAGGSYSTPAGWTIALDDELGNGSTGPGNLLVATKVAVAGDIGATFTFTNSHNNNTSIGWVLAYSGTTSLDGTPQMNTGLGTVITVPSATVTSPSEILIAWILGLGATTTPPAPTGMLSRSSGPASGSQPGYQVATESVNTSGPTGTKSSSQTNNYWSAGAILLAPS